MVTDTLLVGAQTNVVILPGARVFAGSAISGAIFRTIDSFVRTVAFTGGGVVDCADLADIGIHLYRFAHVRVQDLRIDSALVYGIKVGDAATVRSAEAVIRGVHIFRLSGTIPASNNYGIYCENSGDHSFSQIIVQSYRVGVKMTSGTSSLDDVHCWHDPTLGSFDRAFEDDGNGNVYTNCHADTPENYGWYLSGFNTRIDNCTVSIHPTNGINDNVLVGVQFTQASPFATVTNTAFFGGSVTKRIATDISVSGGDLTSLDVFGCVRSQVVTSNSIPRARVAYFRDLTLLDKGTNPSASSGLRGQVNLVRGGTGIADTASVCVKRWDGTYTWEPVAVPDSNTERLASGETTIRRTLATAATLSTGSGQLRLTHFTAAKTETVTQIKMYSGSTAGGATPTLVRIGIYSVAENGDLALIASTANDTALLAAANTAYTKALSSSWSKVAGQRYALGLLVVTAATAPTMVGQGIGSGLPAAELAVSPKLCALLSGQTDLPSSVTDASVFSTTQMYYAALMP